MSFLKSLIPFRSKTVDITKTEFDSNDAQHLLTKHIGLKAVTQIHSGAGAYGYTFTGKDLKLKQTVACKVSTFGTRWINKADSIDMGYDPYRQRQVSFQKEVELLTTISHENIGKYLSCFQLYGYKGRVIKVTDDAEVAFSRMTHSLLITGIITEQRYLSLEDWMKLKGLNALDEDNVANLFKQVSD